MPSNGSIMQNLNTGACILQVVGQHWTDARSQKANKAAVSNTIATPFAWEQNSIYFQETFFHVGLLW